MVDQISIRSYHEKKIVLLPMSPEATVSDEDAKAAKDTTKNNKNTKSIGNKKDKIRLNGQCFLAINLILMN